MLLRDVTEADLPILFEFQRDPVASRMAAFPSRDYEAFMTHWRTKILGNLTNRKQVIIAEGEVVGDIGSWDDHGKRLVGYWIASSHWGRGIATGALRAFLSEHEKTRPIYADVATHNLGSVRVLEKCGFVRASAPALGHDGVEAVMMHLTASV